MLPNTFIAGAQKCGTTTLCSALGDHPEVVVSEPKEPNFFSKAANLARPDIYQSCFQRKRGLEPKAIVDGSNAYMTDPAVAIRIQEMLGRELRFVFSLRDPVQRMVSGYWHQAKKGHDRRTLTQALCLESKSLEDAIEEEEERLQRAIFQNLIRPEAYARRYDDPLWNFRYLRNSLYAGDLDRFKHIFGSGRIFVVLLDDLVSDPLLTICKVAEFLRVDPLAFPDGLELHRNPTRLRRMPRLLGALRRLPGLRLRRAVPGYELIAHALFYRGPDPVPPKSTIRWRMLFAPEVKRLEMMLGRDLSTLWNSK